MKILAASDLHGDRKSVDKLVKKAKKEKVDLIALCGDLTFMESDLSDMVGPFKELGKSIVMIPGNHETFPAIEYLSKKYGPGTYNLHGRSIRIYDNIGLIGVGGANIGLFEIGDKELNDLVKKAHKPVADAKHKILITHVPPHGTKLDALWDHVGSKGLREAIEKIQPDVCLCGHIHETFGVKDTIGKTQIINVGKEGAIIEIND